MRNHRIDKLRLFLFNLWAHLQRGHVLIVCLLSIFCLVAIGPIRVVVRIEGIELKNHLRWSNLRDLIPFILFLFLTLLALILGLVLFGALFAVLSIFLGLLRCLLLRAQRRLQIIALVELGDVSRDLTVLNCFLLLDPLSALLQHILLNVNALNLLNVVHELLLGRVKLHHVVLLQLLAMFALLVHALDGTVRQLDGGFGSTLHTKENHLLLAHLFDLFTGKNTFDAPLNEFGCYRFFLSGVGIIHLTLFDLALDLIGVNLRVVLLQDLLHAESALTTTLILLNPADSRDYFHVESERIVHDFLDWIGAFIVCTGIVLVHVLIDHKLLLAHGLWLLRWLLFSSLFLAFLLFRWFFFLFLASVALDFFFEGQLDLDLIVFLEVAGHWDLNYGWVILQIEQQLVQVNVD